MESTKFHFSSALTPAGWQNDVVVDIDADGTIAAVTPGAAKAPSGGIALPAMPNVHSHAHQRLMLGLAERAGPGADSFWTWREVMYRFLARLTPDDAEDRKSVV